MPRHARASEVLVSAARILERVDATSPDDVVIARLEGAHLVHLPGGDPDLLPAVLHDSRAWTAILRAHAAGACIAGASAGAMAIGERLWTRDGPVDGLGLVPGIAILPHFDPGRLAAWRASVDGSPVDGGRASVDRIPWPAAPLAMARVTARHAD